MLVIAVGIGDGSIGPMPDPTVAWTVDQCVRALLVLVWNADSLSLVLPHIHKCLSLERARRCRSTSRLLIKLWMANSVTVQSLHPSRGLGSIGHTGGPAWKAGKLLESERAIHSSQLCDNLLHHGVSAHFAQFLSDRVLQLLALRCQSRVGRVVSVEECTEHALLCNLPGFGEGCPGCRVEAAPTVRSALQLPETTRLGGHT